MWGKELKLYPITNRKTFKTQILVSELKKMP